MQISFTKMQGAGNDFVVLDETRGLLGLTPAQYRYLGERRFGVGADQILSVRPAPSAEVDFAYVIHNADGGEVEHCGNGARCFYRYVQQQGLTNKPIVKVQTMNRVLSLQADDQGRIIVDMEQPQFDLAALAFDATGLAPVPCQSWEKWPLSLRGIDDADTVSVALLSMGNPHAVLLVDDVDAAPVQTLGPQVQQHPAFTRGVNVGFMQVQNRCQVRLRVYERGAGETPACGTGACAAVVAGIRLGLLDGDVTVQMKGGTLGVRWAGMAQAVFLSGPATMVYQGTIEL